MDLAAFYAAYIDCLNRRDWDRLGDHVGPEVHRNGERLGLDGYRRMLEQDCADIPDLRFEVELLVVDRSRIASRLRFHCTPRGRFLGLAVNGRKVEFTENVFYEVRDARIAQVWSIVDTAAIEAQLRVAPERAD